MTSSFRQPRDPYALGATNYLATAPDLTDAMIKEQDAAIKDTQEFYQQMAELEKQRFEQRDKNLANLTSLIKDSVTIVKKVQQANDDRNEDAEYVDDYEGERDDEKAQESIEGEEKKVEADQKVLAASIDEESKDPTATSQQRDDAKDAAVSLQQGGYSYNESLNVRNNLKRAGLEYKTILNGMIIDNSFGALDNRILTDNPTKDEAIAHVRELRKIYMQAFIAQRREAGDRRATRGEIRKYLAKEMRAAERAVLLKWSENRNKLIAQQTLDKDRQEAASIFNSTSTASDTVGETGWITTKKREYEARGLSASLASSNAFDDFAQLVIPMLEDPDSGIDPAKVRLFLNTEFEFPGGKMKLDDDRAPRGAKGLFQELQAAANKYDDEKIAQDKETEKLKMKSWEETTHVEFVKELNKITDPREAADKVDEYVLNFRKEFNLGSDEANPEFLKNFLANRDYADEAIVVEITSRRRNNLPITQAMVDKILDPDTRDEQAKFVNTPELGAFTEDEAESMEEIAIAIVKEGKQLSDLNQAKTPQYIFARDAAKEYVTARFKELVIGGTPRGTAMDNAIDEAILKMKKGIFDNRKVAAIDVQNTLDLQSTLNAIGKDPSLIYSTEAWAGEKPHLDLAREYIRTGGRSQYPSYYMRFNFIKDADGSYLTPEEIFETRVNKVDVTETKEELPERKELDNVDDQNKLLNKTNGTKILDVATKNNNIEWMIKTKPSVTGLNAEMFIRQLETNIQRQQSIGGISIPHKQKTTLSKEDNDKLLEAVPELKEAPFLNPNTLSPAAINEMLKLNI